MSVANPPVSALVWRGAHDPLGWHRQSDDRWFLGADARRPAAAVEVA